MVELKPCPFCGSAVSLQQKEKSGLWVFRCPDESSCMGSFLGTYGHGEHLDTAITAWNTRAAESRIAQLEAAAQFLLDRLVEYEGDLIDGDAASEFFGHVVPAKARLSAALQNAGGSGD